MAQQSSEPPIETNAQTPAQPTQLPSVGTTIEVRDELTASSGGSVTLYHATAEQVLSSSGTFGDFSRYLQLFPGVVFNNDETNDILVRGGNPIENLYQVDGIPVPNINHIATVAIPGGLVSMVDSAAIENVELLTGGFNASYDERLSSVVEINTRERRNLQPRYQADAGFVGAGGMADVNLPMNGSLFASAHRSLLNLFTDDIGLNGVPIYTNELVRARFNHGGQDQIEFLSLGGLDSINIQPSNHDREETNPVDTQYSGWRIINGIKWEHLLSNQVFGTVTLSDAEQHQTIHQQDQLPLTLPISPHNQHIPIYFEDTNDRITTLKFDLNSQAVNRLALIAGFQGAADRIDYHVSQPAGQQSPFSADPHRSDATSFYYQFIKCSTGSYLQANVRATSALSLSLGGRVQTFALGGHVTATPRLSAIYRINDHASLHASFGDYAQMPPTIYLLAFPQNRALQPIRARHWIAGAELWSGNHGKFTVEFYHKDYRHYPVATEYPQLSLANMVDTLGQQFVWLPMTSRGTGIANGIEFYTSLHFGQRFIGQASFAYARVKHTALDGIPRPGNFDFPLVLNTSGEYHWRPRLVSSFHFETTSGRPYTPFLLGPSHEQDRGIYDLDQVNAKRGPVYSRLDIQTDKTFDLKGGSLTAYAGINNVLDRENFLGYFWMPRCAAVPHCYQVKGGYSEAYQMKLFPTFGIRYEF
jgi:hypothetical protein